MALPFGCYYLLDDIILVDDYILDDITVLMTITCLDDITFSMTLPFRWHCLRDDILFFDGITMLTSRCVGNKSLPSW